MAAIGYARVSTKQQGYHGISLDAQRQRILAYADEHGIRICRIVQEIRRGHNNAVADSCHQRGSAVIVYDVSRFSRNVQNGREQLHKLLRRGVTVHFIAEGLRVSAPGTSHYDRFIEALHAAQAESDVLSRRCRDIVAYKRSRGEYTGGGVPFGLAIVETERVDATGEARRVKKYCEEPQEMGVVEFVHACRMPESTTRQISEVMTRISGYIEPIRVFRDEGSDDEPIDEDDPNFHPIHASTIADLLNEYELSYRGQPFTADIVRRIRSPAELRGRVIDQNTLIDEQIAVLAARIRFIRT